MSNILITGASGYLGSRLVAYLETLPVFSLFLSGRDIAKMKAIFSDKHIFLDYDSIINGNTDISHIDTVIHLASVNEIEAQKNPINAFDIIVLGTEKLINKCISQSVRKFIYLSTIHVYGNTGSGILDEASLTLSIHPYAYLNRIAENFVYDAHIKNSINGIVIRLSNSFGYPIHKNIDRWTLLVNNICRDIVEKGYAEIKSPSNIKRDFIPIEDVINAIYFFIIKEIINEDFPCYNVCSSIMTSIKDIVQKIEDQYNFVTGKKAQIKYCSNDVDTILKVFDGYSNKKIKNLGFNFINNYNNEIKLTIEKCLTWFNRN